MRGPAPKNPKTRQRRNKTSTRAELPPPAEPVVEQAHPPEPHWHAKTVAMWKDLWASEMKGEFLKIDVHRLYMYAELVNDFWLEPSADAHKEVRLAGANFGTTPLDRRRLQWEVKNEDERTKEETTTTAPPPQAKDDPRAFLRAVK